MIDISILKKLANIHVLIVEDDELTAYGLAQSLKKHCRQVDIAHNGIVGFELFEKNKPNVVIADINLPEMNGLEMVASMHAISPHLPVIIITSYDSSENIMGSIEERAYSYLRKPIRMEDLQTTLLMATKDIVNTYVKLEYGFIYDLERKILRDANGIDIVLTKMESDLLYLLISNIDTVIDYITIESYVWQEKSMSLEALRMCIKKIRKKTFGNIIKNVSKCGYKISSFKEDKK